MLLCQDITGSLATFVDNEADRIAVQLGLLTDSVGHRSLPAALDFVASLGLDTVEIGTGNWSESPHADLAALRTGAGARKQLRHEVESRGLRISALNASGNQLHPVSGAEHDRVVRETIAVAAELEVPTVVMMSGLPGARGDSSPNWITSSWPPETLAVLDYQWNEVAIPYWRDLAVFARNHGVQLAVEMHGNQLVHNVATLIRLREAIGGDTVGANLDPSHLIWMGADILAAIRALGSAIINVHAKDARIESHNAGVNGVIDTRSPAEVELRSWNYVTLGLGHPGGVRFWADFVYALRAVGYTGALTIEHEDVLIGADEGVRKSAELLHSVVLRDPPDWAPANI